MREFPSGATRDTDMGKLDYEAFLNPMVVKRYAEYMHKHRQRSDGSLRAGDDWQKGIPSDVYVKSLMRHVMDVWLYFRGYDEHMVESPEDALCAVLFNTFGLLYNMRDGQD